ncbi:hypothetical protein [Halococcoides cellulosivorans]|uniref:Uncharacterized protein n=1 Tax=Halococcoides cellulosivorans TaxID=1679096 RepID=A0A2R4X311_9EURY|nr:hypothetical protein [Halococcoides cellulosivorans]AWB28162.1 hypothetical protein HARCEL1_10820 [Halococcoides cellulosivorans]
MGVAAITSSAAGSATVTSLLSPVGFGVGGVVVAALLIGLLAYLDVLTARPETDSTVRVGVIAAVIPLGLTFGAVVLFQTLQLV